MLAGCNSPNFSRPHKLNAALIWLETISHAYLRGLGRYMSKRFFFFSFSCIHIFRFFYGFDYYTRAGCAYRLRYRPNRNVSRVECERMSGIRRMRRMSTLFFNNQHDADVIESFYTSRKEKEKVKKGGNVRMGRRRWVSLLIISTRGWWGLWYWNIDYYWRWRHRQIEKQMNVLPDRKLRQSKINGAHTPPLNSIKPKLRFSSFHRARSPRCVCRFICIKVPLIIL